MNSSTPYLSLFALLAPFSAVCAADTAATESASQPIGVYAESAVSLSDGLHTPFWLTANRFGLASLERNNAYVSAGVLRETQNSNKLSVGFGAELAAAYRFDASVYVQQAYVALQYRWLQLTAGSRAYEPEIVERRLSSGGLVYSGNARPVPQLRISIPEYVSLGFTNHWFALRGHLAYGIFTDNGFQKDFTAGKHAYVTNTLYHSKALFAKVGKPESLVDVEGGIEWYGQFGGNKHFTDGTVYKAPHKLEDFFKMLIPLSGGSDSPVGDQTNVLGNHIGAWHGAVTVKPGNWRIKGYAQHLFEDHSQLFAEYGRWKDGLLGLEITLPANSFVSKFLYEFMNSRDQSGPIYHDTTEAIPDQVSARDAYWDHYFYQTWQHGGNMMGTPVIYSPLYNNNGSINIRSNRTRMHHVGIEGAPATEWGYRMLLSYVQHWGTYSSPFDEISDTFSGMAEVRYSPTYLPGWDFRLAAALDRSDWIGNNTGATVTVRKSFKF
ncbi:MAG: capsule assembly Wzi family protein [Bacteroidales bacterium]